MLFSAEKQLAIPISLKLQRDLPLEIETDEDLAPSERAHIETRLRDDQWAQGFDDLKLLQDRFGKQKYLEVFLSHYNLSQFADIKSRFTNLMMCMEALYSGGQEIRFRIATRVATLFGRTEKDRKTIYDNMSCLYNMRNRLVHGSKNVEVSEEDINLLQKYSKCSLMAFIRIDGKRGEVLSEIDGALFSNEGRLKIQERIKKDIEMFEMGKYDISIPLETSILDLEPY